MKNCTICVSYSLSWVFKPKGETPARIIWHRWAHHVQWFSSWVEKPSEHIISYIFPIFLSISLKWTYSWFYFNKIFHYSSFPPSPPHQNALNQFHALQMLFTLLGMKHLQLAATGFFTFLSRAGFYFQRLHKEAWCGSGKVWRRLIARDANWRPGRCSVFISPCSLMRGSAKFNSARGTFLAAIYSLHSPTPRRVCYEPRLLLKTLHHLEKGKKNIHNINCIYGRPVNAVFLCFFPAPWELSDFFVIFKNH